MIIPINIFIHMKAIDSITRFLQYPSTDFIRLWAENRNLISTFKNCFGKEFNIGRVMSRPVAIYQHNGSTHGRTPLEQHNLNTITVILLAKGETFLIRDIEHKF